jgi:predicted small secreted protein
MKATRSILLVALVAAGAMLAGGCATTKEGDVSSIPWDRPEQWEGSGALGGFRPPGSPGY